MVTCTLSVAEQGATPCRAAEPSGYPKASILDANALTPLEEMGLWQCSGVEVYHLSTSVH